MRTVVALAMVVAASAANAQQSRSFPAAGFGTRTCGQFAQQYGGVIDLEQSYFDWAQGFMSGMNFWSALAEGGDTVIFRDLGSMSIKDQMTYLRSYCNNHQFNSYLEAVVDLYQSLPMQTVQRWRR